MTTTQVRFGHAFCICLLVAGNTLGQQDSAFGSQTVQHRRLEVPSLPTARDSLAEGRAERKTTDQQADVLLSKSAALAYANAQFSEAERLWRRSRNSHAFP